MNLTQRLGLGLATIGLAGLVSSSTKHKSNQHLNTFESQIPGYRVHITLNKTDAGMFKNIGIISNRPNNIPEVVLGPKFNGELISVCYLYRSSLDAPISGNEFTSYYNTLTPEEREKALSLIESAEQVVPIPNLKK